MPLPRPTLDTRSFDSLVAEGQALVTRSFPAWTDHNASDPGITLLELFAWLGEQDFYRLDRVTDAARRSFVRLSAMEPGLPTVAQTVVALTTPASAVALPARMQIDGTDGPAFETVSAVDVLATQIVGAGTQDAASPQHEIALPAPEATFAPFGTRPRRRSALLLAFDRALQPAGTRVSLHAWTDHWRDDVAARAAQRAGLAANPRDARHHYGVRTTWEYFSTAGIWRPLADVDDETRALSLSGFVRFTAPPDHGAHGAGGRPPHYPVRCRLVAGRFDRPPRLVRVAINAVACEHAVSRTARAIGVARGHAGALFALGAAPVVAGSVTVAVDGAHDGAWHDVPDWDRAGAHDRVVRLVPERGEIQSGDGQRGAILPAGARLSASYRVGGGAAGNVAADTLQAIALNDWNVERAPALAALGAPVRATQGFPATGGSEREPLALAQARAFEKVTAVERAVTLADIERLALATPGVPVARVRAIAGLDPPHPCWPAAGVVTVVVIPASPRPAPLPSQALLDAVARHLDARRLVTCELRLVAPRYRRVGVSAVLHVAIGTDAQSVLRAARARVTTYFDARRGGPDGTGWPFGRAVYRSDVLAQLAALPGVACVTGFGLLDGASGAPTCDNVVLCPAELVRPGRLQLRATSDPARGDTWSEPA